MWLHFSDFASQLFKQALIEPSHGLKNQTVSFTDVSMAECSEEKTEDLRRAS